MTTTDWIIDIVLVLIVLRQIREERLTVRFVLIPLGIVAFTAHTYLHNLPTAGNDLNLIGLCLGVGGALGLVGGLVTKVRGADGVAYVRAGFSAAGLWVASMGARLAFIIYITHSAGEQHLLTFSLDHRITGADVWQTALVVLALSEVLVRIAVILVRGRLVATASRRTPVAELVAA